MPIYMDVHILPGVKAKDVAEAHQLDLFHANDYQCKCMTYWLDEARQTVFCLIEAPDKEAVTALHNKAHGLLPNKIIEVSNSVVQSFLGRIYDPDNAVADELGLKVFTDPSLRVLLVTDMEDPVLLAHTLGAEAAAALVQRFHEIVRTNMAQYGGMEAQHKGRGFVLAFAAARQAAACALAIQGAIISGGNTIPGVTAGLHAGEPVDANEELFGDTIRFARCLRSIARSNQVVMSSAVRALLQESPLNRQGNVMALPPQDEEVLALLFAKLEDKWTDPAFDMADYCNSVTMSKSQLYRKAVALTGLSPNVLLKDFRLERAKDMLKQQRYSISHVTFNTGFSSPSYFTKCFKKKYGLLPMAYVELLQ